MSLVHPLIEPQMALRACTGHFFGDSDEYVALLYSNRIVFRQVDLSANPPLISGEDVVISIPQPPMTMGDPSSDAHRNIGGVFFSVGRNKDMLTLQFRSSLLILSINSVEQTLELQGCWGLSKLKDSSYKSSSKVSTQKLSKTPSSASLASLAAAETGASGPQRPPLRTSNSSTHIKPVRPTSNPSNSTLNQSHPQSHHHISHSLGKLNLNHLSGAVQGSVSAGHSDYLSGRSGMCIWPDLPSPKPSPDGTQIFLVTKNKQEYIHLIIISCFGKEIMKLETDYLDVLTLGWISEDMIYIVYLNAKFHKKFQVFRLANHLKTNNIFGIGRKSVKPSLVPETNVPIALDFQPCTSDICGSSDLIFKDYVLLGTRKGGYLRINYRSASWEPVLNAKNILGAINLGDTSLVVQCGKTQRLDTCPQEVSQLTYSIVSESTVHAIKADTMVSACLCSKHNIDSDNRFTLKLLHLGNGFILDFKREPFHFFKYTSTSKSQIPLRLILPPDQDGNTALPSNLSLKPSKLTIDFLVKTEQALYTRDPNGDDNSVRKIVDSNTVFDIALDRSKLIKLSTRDIKSFWALFEDPTEIRIIEESFSKASKLKNKASFVFEPQFSKWKFCRIHQLYRNLVVVTLTNLSTTISEDEHQEWAMFIVNFIGSTSKSAHVPARAHLVMRSSSPEMPPRFLATPGQPGKVFFHIFHSIKKIFAKSYQLSVTSGGEHQLKVISSGIMPISMDESESITFFTDLHGPLDGILLLGSTSPSNCVVHDVFIVESSSKALEGRAIVLSNPEVIKSTIWLFDTDGYAFREFAAREILPEKASRIFGHHEQLLRLHQNQSNTKFLKLSAGFNKTHFVETSSSNQFRPLPELPALLCRGIGNGVDAEVYLKTPDAGYFAIFRIQNKKLREALSRLERTVLDKQIGVWLPDELRESWLEEFDGSTMISSAFATFWKLTDEQQLELCKEASVDLELMRKVRPM